MKLTKNEVSANSERAATWSVPATQQDPLQHLLTVAGVALGSTTATRAAISTP
jgi:hypothetical protein